MEPLAYVGPGAFALAAATIDWISVGTVYFDPSLPVALGLVL